VQGAPDYVAAVMKVAKRWEKFERFSGQCYDEIHAFEHRMETKSAHAL
jgi:hypothetical protein